MLDALLCLTDPGDEVVLTDPTYAACSTASASSAPSAPRAAARASTAGGASTWTRCVPR